MRNPINIEVTIKYSSTNLCPQLYLENYISSLDFNPTGETVATIEHHGRCLISDINTNKYAFHYDVGNEGNSIICKLNFLPKSAHFILRDYTLNDFSLTIIVYY